VAVGVLSPADRLQIAFASRLAVAPSDRSPCAAERPS